MQNVPLMQHDRNAGMRVKSRQTSGKEGMRCKMQLTQQSIKNKRKGEQIEKRQICFVEWLSMDEAAGFLSWCWMANGMTEVIRQISLTPTLSFLSCRAYGKQGMTAVTLEAEAILQALIMISSSIKLSLISPQPLWTM